MELSGMMIVSGSCERFRSTTKTVSARRGRTNGLLLFVVTQTLLLGTLLERTTAFSASTQAIPVLTTTVSNQKQIALFLKIRRRRGRYGSDNDADDEDDDENDSSLSSSSSSSIPQLPAIGFSSFNCNNPSSSSETTTTLNSGEAKVELGLSRKFELQYTCNICETRNCHQVSRIAYRNGVVIARCKGCQTQHLIADHLGWTDYKGGFQGDTNTIEDYFLEKGQEGVVNRVGPDAFHLEKILRHNTQSGSIVGDDGKPALE